MDHQRQIAQLNQDNHDVGSILDLTKDDTITWFRNTLWQNTQVLDYSCHFENIRLRLIKTHRGIQLRMHCGPEVKTIIGDSVRTRLLECLLQEVEKPRPDKSSKILAKAIAKLRKDNDDHK